MPKPQNPLVMTPFRIYLEGSERALQGLRMALTGPRLGRYESQDLPGFETQVPQSREQPFTPLFTHTLFNALFSPLPFPWPDPAADLKTLTEGFPKVTITLEHPGEWIYAEGGQVREGPGPQELKALPQLHQILEFPHPSEPILSRILKLFKGGTGALEELEDLMVGRSCKAAGCWIWRESSQGIQCLGQDLDLLPEMAIWVRENPEGLMQGFSSAAADTLDLECIPSWVEYLEDLHLPDSARMLQTMALEHGMALLDQDPLGDWKDFWQFLPTTPIREGAWKALGWTDQDLRDLKNRLSAWIHENPVKKKSRELDGYLERLQ